jgi:hypothetical protein
MLPHRGISGIEADSMEIVCAEDSALCCNVTGGGKRQGAETLQHCCYTVDDTAIEVSPMCGEAVKIVHLDGDGGSVFHANHKTPEPVPINCHRVLLITLEIFEE